MNILILSLFISSFTLIILIQTKKISQKYGFYDNPSKDTNKIHKHPVSNIGGLACLVPFLLSIIIAYINEDDLSKKFLIIVFITSLCFYSLGRLDDIKNLSPNRKFLSFCLIFLFFFPFEQNLILNELHFKYIGLFVDLGNYGIFFTLFCIFLFYNASNFIDGINGLYGTTIIYWLIFLILITGKFTLPVMTLILSLVIFLFFNFKNKVFIGNSGNSFITCFLASCYIYYYNKFGNFYCDEIFLAFFVPGLDTVRLSIERLIKRKSPFSGDNQHLHHLILKYFNQNIAFLSVMSLILLPILLLLLTRNFYISLLISSLIYFSLLIYLKKSN